MSFIRPEAQVFLGRWGGLMVWGGLALFNLWLALTSTGLYVIIGGIAGLFAAWMAWDALRNLRIQRRSGGSGVVEIVERRITWFAASDGVAFSLDDVIAIDIETYDQGIDDIFWAFSLSDGERHLIPGAAEGAQAFIDALSLFPGANYENVIKASTSTDCARFSIWQKRD